MSVSSGRLQRTFPLKPTDEIISDLEQGHYKQRKSASGMYNMLVFVLVLGLLSFLLLQLVISHTIDWWQSLAVWGGVALLFLFVYK
jgi:hypothetical protein